LLNRIPALAQFAALALLAWILAHWSWVLLAPRQQAVQPAAAAASLSKVLAEKVVTLHLFGGGTVGSEATPALIAAAPSNISLRGIYATADGRSGFAALVIDGNPVAAVVGQEFAPGMVLQRAYPDSIEMLRGGQVESVRLPNAPISGTGGVNPATSGIGGTPQLQIRITQLGAQQFAFARKELLAALKRPDQLALLGRYVPHPRGGALLERSPSGGLPEKLGLKVGDVITSLNGKSLSGPGDVARLYDQLVKNERVSVDVLRSGGKMNFGLQVTP
jgi:type II secretory pathway component PulC